MLKALWWISKGHRFSPWRNPYLLWRIETYSGLHAERITVRDFWRFVWNERRALARFLSWAGRMHARQ